ncbi:hypothetical protein IMSHALPRED_005708 [Imshaugia aleurites]|uniref:Uncharacterized protein n=1 Tax=Imshaugia aleurites TaxID=172621 RepID=A0A8H3FKF6_9LECA|nr:hypothetical protein IMSHALPRED_005708 [Imshaugia aleurites]
MASSDEDSKRPKPQDDANPFVSFRRFADYQMSTFMNGVFSISSLFGSSSNSPRHSVQDYEKWLQEARGSSQRLASEAEEAGRIMDVYTRAHKEGRHAIREPAGDERSEHLRCPYRPAEQEAPRSEMAGLDMCPMDDPTCSSLSLAALGLCLPINILSAPLLGEQLPTVDIAYLLYSPYSPVQLEKQRDHGAKWREAFEDLLAVQNGQKLPPKHSQRTPESSFDWVRGMIGSAMCKLRDDTLESSSAAGATSEAIKENLALLSLYTSIREPENDADEDADADNDDLDDNCDDEGTELDVYNRIFGSQQASSNSTAPRSFAPLQQAPSLSDTDGKKQSILSTLTTTERTTLEDGSVHTKVVLKKRFSDGREESTETVHHQNAVHQTQDAPSKAIKNEDDRKMGKDQEIKVNKSSGWFWS